MPRRMSEKQIVRTRTDDKPHNYLCEGYRRFCAHAAPYIDFMADEYRTGARRPMS